MEEIRNETGLKRKGIITCGVGGLYTVRIFGDSSDDSIEVLCRARGILRREHITPAVGDSVVISRSSPDEDYGEPVVSKNKKGDISVDYVIEEIGERRNSLIRPPMSNLDYLFAVVPCASPEPDLLTLDKLTAIAENSGIETVVVINKADLSPEKASEISDIYNTAGYKVFPVSCETGDGIADLSAFISSLAVEAEEKGFFVTGAFAGVSGAGKSTLMTKLFPDLNLKTGSVSRKTERGRHTTRHVELYPVKTDGGLFWIADTPGFSMLDFTRFDFFPYEDLALSFREFEDCLGRCRYTKCTHLCEDGCAVIEKKKNGLVAESRHESYKRIFEEQRSVPEWKRRQEQKQR